MEFCSRLTTTDMDVDNAAQMLKISHEASSHTAK